MSQKWLRSLFEKGIEIEQEMRRNFGQIKDQVQGQFETRLKEELESRGIRLNAADLAAVIEEVSPQVSRTALSYALDVVRPFSAGMGFRISHFTDEHIEFVLPARTRNKNEKGQIHEGAIFAAAIEAAKLLWMRHAEGDLKIFLQQVTMQNRMESSEDLRLKIDLSEGHREAVLAELREKQDSESRVRAKVFDRHDTEISEIEMIFSLKMPLSLEREKH